MEFARLLERVLDEGNTELENAIMVECDRQLRKLDDEKFWILYTECYGSAKRYALFDYDGVCELASDMECNVQSYLDTIISNGLNLSAAWWVENPDVNNMMSDGGSVWTVENLRDILECDDEVLEHCVDTESWWWLDTDTDEMRLLISEAEAEVGDAWEKEMRDKIADLQRQISDLEKELRKENK